MMRRPCIATLVTYIALTTSGCGAGEQVDSSAGLEWQAVHDTIGDTIVVRTITGSIWREPAELVPEVRVGVFDGVAEYIFGELIGLAVGDDGSIYVYDRQARSLNKYSPDGTFLATFGREGAGPGEYRSPDSGLAVLPDGRIALRDPANARINLYSPEGESVGNWPIRGGLQTSQPLFVDTMGTVATLILLNPTDAITEWESGLARIHPDGTPADTVKGPDYDHEAPQLRAERTGADGNHSVGVTTVPFSPGAVWTLSPHGYVVGGVSTDYAIDLFRAAEPHLRIERDHEPVPVKSGERSAAERRATAQMRNLDPNWRWSGPPVPDRKPAFRDILVGEDGRIWVQLYQPGYEVAGEEVHESNERGGAPPARWREPVVFDLFEPDGRYLGQVRAPDGFSLFPAPVMRGDQVWAVVRDELDVQYITRFRVTPASRAPHADREMS